MLHLQFQDELAQRRKGPIRKRLEPEWRAELLDYTEASIRRLERIRYRLNQRQS